MTWVSNFCMSCIYQYGPKQMKKYFLLTCNKTQTLIYLFEQFGDVDFLVDKICDIIRQKFKM